MLTFALLTFYLDYFILIFILAAFHLNNNGIISSLEASIHSLPCHFTMIT